MTEGWREQEKYTVAAVAIVSLLIVASLVYFFLMSPPPLPLGTNGNNGSTGGGAGNTSSGGATITLDGTGKPFRGGEAAPVVIFEVSDFECPYCARVQPTLKQLEADYGTSIKLMFVHAPYHSNSLKAAVASECANDQGKFWEMHDTLFANQQALDDASLKQYAAGIGLDTAKFNSCLDSQETLSRVRADQAQVDQKVVPNVPNFGTPTFIINGKVLVGAQPYDSFKSMIDAELKN